MDSWRNVTRTKAGLLLCTLLYVVVFGFISFTLENYEFVFYTGVVLGFVVLIGILNYHFNVSHGVLGGLSMWGLIHMAGGNITLGGTTLYGIWLLPFFRYDHFAHFFGFFVATLLAYELLRPSLVEKRSITVLVLLVFIGMGMGVVNEIVEFIAVVVLPETGVGGYENTMLDLIWNTIGAIVAVGVLKIRERL